MVLTTKVSSFWTKQMEVAKSKIKMEISFKLSKANKKMEKTLVAS